MECCLKKITECYLKVIKKQNACPKSNLLIKNTIQKRLKPKQNGFGNRILAYTTISVPFENINNRETFRTCGFEGVWVEPVRGLWGGREAAGPRVWLSCILKSVQEAGNLGYRIDWDSLDLRLVYGLLYNFFRRKKCGQFEIWLRFVVGLFCFCLCCSRLGYGTI